MKMNDKRKNEENDERRSRTKTRLANYEIEYNYAQLPHETLLCIFKFLNVKELCQGLFSFAFFSFFMLD